MLLRWVGGVFQLTEKNFRKIMVFQDRWTLTDILGLTKRGAPAHKQKVA